MADERLAPSSNPKGEAASANGLCNGIWATHSKTVFSQTRKLLLPLNLQNVSSSTACAPRNRPLMPVHPPAPTSAKAPVAHQQPIPMQTPSTSTCAKCRAEIKDTQRCNQCVKCGKWTHRSCVNFRQRDAGPAFLCAACVSTSLAESAGVCAACTKPMTRGLKCQTCGRAFHPACVTERIRYQRPFLCADCLVHSEAQKAQAQKAEAKLMSTGAISKIARGLEPGQRIDAAWSRGSTSGRWLGVTVRKATSYFPAQARCIAVWCEKHASWCPRVDLGNDKATFHLPDSEISYRSIDVLSSTDHPHQITSCECMNGPPARHVTLDQGCRQNDGPSTTSQVPKPHEMQSQPVAPTAHASLVTLPPASTMVECEDDSESNVVDDEQSSDDEPAAESDLDDLRKTNIDGDRQTLALAPTADILSPRGSAARSWYVFSRQPPNVHSVVWNQLAEATRRSHIRWLNALKAMPPDLLSAPLPVAVVELVLRLARDRSWSWPTISGALSSVGSALAKLPIYTNVGQPIDLRQFPYFDAALRHAQRRAKIASVAPAHCEPLSHGNFLRLANEAKGIPGLDPAPAGLAPCWSGRGHPPSASGKYSPCQSA